MDESHELKDTLCNQEARDCRRRFEHFFNFTLDQHEVKNIFLHRNNIRATTAWSLFLFAVID